MIMYDRFHIPDGYSVFTVIPLAGVVAALFAIPIGWISLRTRRETFVVITLATFYIFQLLAANLKGITHGNDTFFFQQPPWVGDFYNYPFYFVSLAILVVTFLVAWWIRRSKYGIGLLAIREDEDRARGLGINTGAYKLSAFVISAFFGGLVGAITIYYNGSINPPSAFDPVFDVMPVLMAFLGGVGTLTGPLVGAVVFQLVSQYVTPPLSSFLAGLGYNLEQGYINLIITGLFLLLVLLFLPEGIVPTLSKLWLRFNPFDKRETTKSIEQENTSKAQVEASLLAESSSGGE
jgi:branched-chain amino acid transport system permease protein